MVSSVIACANWYKTLHSWDGQDSIPQEKGCNLTPKLNAQQPTSFILN
jgi:hypothetical protein